jgi:Tfp pilus assembly protein PilF
VIIFSAVIAASLPFTSLTPNAEAKKAKGASTAEPADENFNKGVARYKEKDFDGAADSFLQATYFARNGYNPEAYFWLGKSYMAKHEDIKALEAFKKHVEQNMSKSPQAHIYMAEILMRNDKDQAANDEAKNALKDSEGMCPEAHNIMGQLCIKNSAFMDGEWQFLTALGDHPWKYTDAWMNMAEGRLKAKNYIGAYDLLQKLMDAKGRLDHVDEPRVYYDMGLCKLARGDHQGAMDHFHECLQLDPNFYKSHLELAIMFESEKHYSSAIKEYGDFMQSAPANDPKVNLAKERIQMLEQKVSAAAPPPTVAPSPYMRQQQAQQIQKMQQNQPPKDPGF